ncbi:hypothetical protein ACFQ60_01935 [Streptomyces zhihengii]
MLAVEPQNVTAWLHPQPVRALDGIGPAQERTLTSYGVHTIGLLAHLPEATVQQLIGGRAPPPTARAGPRPRPPHRRRHRPAPQHQHTAPPAGRHPRPRTAALRGAVTRGRTGERLRGRRQAARALTLTVGFAGGSQIERSRRLSLGASAHTDDLRDLAYDLLASSASSAPGYAA